jgi:hypothetical protein
LRLRRDVLFSYEDLIVSFGGVAALFLGIIVIAIRLQRELFTQMNGETRSLIDVDL